MYIIDLSFTSDIISSFKRSISLGIMALSIPDTIKPDSFIPIDTPKSLRLSIFLESG